MAAWDDEQLRRQREQAPQQAAQPTNAGTPWGALSQSAPQWKDQTQPPAPTGQPGDNAPDRSGQPWGTFGNYGNWAGAFAAQHGGRAPTALDERDFWDSQMFASQYGRGPTGGEWWNRWHTGDWGRGMPWQLVAGTPYYGEPFQSQRGMMPSQAYQNAVASPMALPQWLQQGFVPWYGQQYGLGAQPTTPPAAPVATPQYGQPAGRSDDRQRYSSGLGVPPYNWYGRG